MFKILGKIVLIVLAAGLVSGVLYLTLNGTSSQAANLPGNPPSVTNGQSFTPGDLPAHPNHDGIERGGHSEGSAFGLAGIAAKSLVIGLIIGLVAFGQRVLEWVIPGRRFSTN